MAQHSTAQHSTAQHSTAQHNRTVPLGKNRLYYGDNLDILRKLGDQSVDLCYIDPPFNSKRNYSQIYNNIGTDGDRAQAQAFEDTWTWDNAAISGIEYILDPQHQHKFTEQTVELMRGLDKVLKRGALLAYLVHMTLRIVEIHRVLKPTGSFYLHCDPTASHYLKLVCDGIFCGAEGGEFLNEIIWSYRTGGMSKRWFGRKHDIVFLFAKNKTAYLFEPQKEKSYLTHKYGFTNVEIFQEPSPDNRYYTLAGMRDVWAIDGLRGNQPERLGYPTQKPEALLERIIKASSNEGDVVLDAYCGCGTTVAVAQRLGRRWIGIDITYQAISLILKRLQDKYPEPQEWSIIEASLKVEGVPRDMNSAIALANRKDDKTRKEFEKWAVLTYSSNQARINDKKGADKGVDGIAYFMLDKDKSGKVIFQVKSGGANRATLATLNSDRQREGAEFGYLISMDIPTKAMLEEVKAAGKFKHPLLSREDDRIQIVTIEEMLAGKRLDLPMSRDVVKSAEAVGDSDLQQGLI